MRKAGPIFTDKHEEQRTFENPGLKDYIRAMPKK
jgi:hypothetical protein